MESAHLPAPHGSALGSEQHSSGSSTPPYLEKVSPSHNSSRAPAPADAEKVDSSSTHQHDGGRLSQQASRQLSRQLSRIATSDYPEGLRLAMIVLALVLSMFLVALDMTIVATAIPRITDQFHSLDQVGWYGSAFFLTLASFQSTWGKVYKYFPLKLSFLISIFIFEVGSLICAVANNSTTLIVGRAIAGAGGAGIASGG
jgi:Major Facilitator Superfamily